MKLLAAHEQAAPIRAGGDTDRLGIFNQFIREALFDGLTTCHVGCICHHVHDDCFGKPGFSLVDLGLHLIPCVLLRSLLPQLIGVIAAEKKLPALVNHNDAGRIDLDRIAGAHDDAAARHGHAVHNAGELCTASGKLAQPVMNHVRGPGVAAVAVHADCDVLAGRNLLEVLQKLAEQNVLPLNGFTPPVCRLLLVDVAIHGDLGRAARFIRSGHGVDLFADRNSRRIFRFHARFLLHSSPLAGGVFPAGCCTLPMAASNSFSRAS